MKGATMQKAAIVWGYALLFTFSGLFAGHANLLSFGDNSNTTFTLYANVAEISQACCLFFVALLVFLQKRPIQRLIPYAASSLLIAGCVLTLYQVMNGNSSPVLSSMAGVLRGCGQGACLLCWFWIYAQLEKSNVVRAMVVSTVLSSIVLLVVGTISSAEVLFGAIIVIVAGCCALMHYCLSAASTPIDSLDLDGIGQAQDKNPQKKPRYQANQNEFAQRPDSCRFLSWMLAERRSLLCFAAITFACGAQRIIPFEGFLPQNVAQLLFSVGCIGGSVIFWMAERRNNETNSSYYRLCATLLTIMATCGMLSSLQDIRVQAVLCAIDNIAFTIALMCTIMMALEAVRKLQLNPLYVGGIVCGIIYLSTQLGRLVCMSVLALFGMDTIGTLVVSIIILYVVAVTATSPDLLTRQAAKNDSTPVQTDSEGSPADDAQKCVVISLANVTEQQLRENPVYKQQYKLTDREIDVAVLLLAGYNSANIADMLTISVNTVKTHLKNLYAKTNVHNRSELIKLLNEIEGQRQQPS